MRASALALALLLAACSPGAPLAPVSEVPTPEASAPVATTPVADTAPTAVRARALADAMQRADTEAAGVAMAALLLDAGLDLPDDLWWYLQPFDEPLNFYNPVVHAVMLSEIPTLDQTPRYWAAWSALLTSGTWAPEAFFRDAEEAQRLAAFNQAVLAVHELGHALAYRYGVNPRTDDGNVNCQELLADRVAAAALDRLARADARFGDLRTRYLALLASLNAAVPEDARYTMPPRQRLLANCRSTVVANPTADPQSLVPYASAFFARHARLHEDGAPDPLAALADSLFLPGLRAYNDRAPEARGPVQISTEGPYVVERDAQQHDAATHVAELIGFMREYEADEFTIETAAVAVSPAGEAWALAFHATLIPDSASATNTLRVTHLSGDGSHWDQEFGLDPDGEAWTIEALAAPFESAFVGLAQLATVSDSSRATFRLFRFGSDDRLQWGPALHLAPAPDGYRIFRLPSGLMALASGGVIRVLDAETLAIGDPSGTASPEGMHIVGVEDEPGGVLVVDPLALGVMTYSDGRMDVEPGGSILYRTVAEGDSSRRIRLAGSGYPSTRDSTDPDAVAFQHILAGQPLADGTIIVIEAQTWEGPSDAIVVRRLRAAE